jgi:hypothetical protein
LGDRYDWALVRCRKDESEGIMDGILYQSEWTMGKWSVKEQKFPTWPPRMPLIRIMIGKVLDNSKLGLVLRLTPPEHCVWWVKTALERVQTDGTCLSNNSVLDWEEIRDKAMAYCQRKKDVRRFEDGLNFDLRRPATYDLVEDVEVIP